MTDGTTLLFGLPGVEVERVERLADGTRVVHAVTAGEASVRSHSSWRAVAGNRQLF